MKPKLFKDKDEHERMHKDIDAQFKLAMIVEKKCT